MSVGVLSREMRMCFTGSRFMARAATGIKAAAGAAMSMPAALIERLSAQGLAVNDEELDGKAVRFVAAWNTPASQVDDLLKVLADHC